MPSSWVEIRVGELGHLLSGGTPSTQEPSYWDGEIPWITSADISDQGQLTYRRKITPEGLKQSATNLAPQGSLLVVTRVGLGKVALAPFPLSFSQDTQALVFNQDLLDGGYLLYAMGWVARSFKFWGRGTTISGIPRKQLEDSTIPLPPLPEQHRIVAAIEEQFTRLDAAVAALQRAQANLKRYRASVLKAACEGHLIPTEAELARQEGRDYEPASQLLERILTERRARWESQEKRRGKYQEPAPPDTRDLPELPQGWVWATVAQLSSRIEYGTSFKAGADPSGIPVLRMGNIQNGELDFSELKYLPSDNPEAQKTMLTDGDLLFNRTNSAELVGKTAVYKNRYPAACFASYLIRVSFMHNFSADYACTFINSQHGRAYIGRVRNQQVGQANVNGTKLAAMPIPLPPLAEQRRIVAEVERRISVIQQAEATTEASLKRAERLRQSILKRAFEGQLVPQDPDDEPASVLLERIKRERAVQPPPTRRNTRRRAGVQLTLGEASA